MRLFGAISSSGTFVFEGAARGIGACSSLDLVHLGGLVDRHGPEALKRHVPCSDSEGLNQSELSWVTSSFKGLKLPNGVAEWLQFPGSRRLAGLKDTHAAYLPPPCFTFRVLPQQGFRFWVVGLGVRVWVQGLGFGVSGSGFRDQDLRFGLCGVGCRV